MKGPVPRETVEKLAEHIREFIRLQGVKAGAQAELIRWCVTVLLKDPDSYRMRGHEGYTDKKRIRSENLRNRRKAFIYLQWLATQLEDQADSVR